MNRKHFFLCTVIIFISCFIACDKSDNEVSERPPIVSTDSISLGIWKKYSNVNGTVYDLSVYGNAIYAATDSGIFKSEDTARTWVNIFGSISGKSICKVSDVLFLAGTKTGLYKSTNGGNTWMLFDNIPAVEVNFVVCDYDGNIWVGLDVSGGTYFSDDLGISWNNRISGQYNNETPFSFEALSSQTVFLGGASAAYFMKSTDTAWTQIPIQSGMDFPYTAAIKHMQDSLMLACVWHTNALGYSTNLGRTWQHATFENNQFYSFWCTKFLSLDSVYLASDLHGILASRNGGVDWTAMNDSLTADDKWFWSLVQIDDYVFAGSSKGTIYRYRYR